MVNFFNGVAEEVRADPRAARRSLADRAHRPHRVPASARTCPNHPKANTLDLSRLLVDVVGKDDPTLRATAPAAATTASHERPLDDIILQDAKDAITRRGAR